MPGALKPSHQHVFPRSSKPCFGASRFSQEAKKENIHQRKMLETKCVPSVRSILFIAILTKILGKAIFDSSTEGGAMPGT